MSHIGGRFGRLLVEKEDSKKAVCLCSCGVRKSYCKYKVYSGHTKSCGCMRSEMVTIKNTTHGMRKTSTYASWQSMRSRCNNKNYPKYKDYGARGIRVHSDWDRFEVFFKDMGERPKGTTLDRRDNNGNYCPNNCRWATDREQRLNKRTSRIITAFGETKTLKEWEESTGIPRRAIHLRIKRGWDIERALSEGVSR